MEPLTQSNQASCSGPFDSCNSDLSGHSSLIRKIGKEKEGGGGEREVKTEAWMNRDGERRGGSTEVLKLRCSGAAVSSPHLAARMA